MRRRPEVYVIMDGPSLNLQALELYPEKHISSFSALQVEISPEEGLHFEFTMAPKHRIIIDTDPVSSPSMNNLCGSIC